MMLIASLPSEPIRPARGLLAALLHEPVVVAHDELGVQAVDEVQGDAHDDQHGRAAEEVGQVALQPGMLPVMKFGSTAITARKARRPG